MAVHADRKDTLKTLTQVVTNPEITPTVEMDVTLADAYIEHQKNQDYVDEIQDELEQRLDSIITDSPDMGKEIKNTYTKKLTLEEDFEDFSILTPNTEIQSTLQEATKEDDEEDDDWDPHLDYSMMDFLYDCLRGLQGNSNRNPDPKRFLGLSRNFHTFSEVRRDRYSKPVKDKFSDYFRIHDEVTDILYDPAAKITKSTSYPPTWIINNIDTGIAVDDSNDTGFPTITIDAWSGKIDLYRSSDAFSRFDDALKLCSLLDLDYTSPTPTKSKDAYWDYRMTVQIPMSAPGYPMTLSDFFVDKYDAIDKAAYEEELAAAQTEADRKKIIPYTPPVSTWSIEDVMHPAFVKTYYSKHDKLRKESEKEIKSLHKQATENANDRQVDKILADAVTTAFADSEDLELVHLPRLLKTLKQAKLKFDVSDVTKRFLDAVNDDPYADEDDE